MCCEGFNPTEGNGKECELSITNKLQRSQMEFEKQKPVGGTRSKEAFKRAGQSADFPGSKLVRRINPLQGNKK